MKKNKIIIFTSDLSTKSGWGRYSLDLIKQINEDFELVVVGHNAVNETDLDLKILNVLPAPMDFNRNYFLAPWYAWKLKNLLGKFEIIHVLVEPYSFIAYLLARLNNKKYLITAHGTYGILPFSFSFPKRLFHKVSFKKANKIICVSNYTKNSIAQFGINNLVVINNGVDFNRFYSATPSLEKGNYILGVGMLKHRKGYHVSLRAFASILEKFPNLQYYLVGDQEDIGYFKYLKDLVFELGIEDRVFFLHSLSENELSDLYNKANLFVLTPVSENGRSEGFGLVYLEAGAHGLPVIGSMMSGAEDAIKGGETGFLVPQNNPELIANAMIKIIGNKEISLEMGKNGIKWAMDHDWSRVAPHYIEVYRDLLR